MNIDKKSYLIGMIIAGVFIAIFNSKRNEKAKRETDILVKRTTDELLRRVAEDQERR